MSEAQMIDTEASDPGTGEYRLNWQLVGRESRELEALVLNATEAEAHCEAAGHSYRARRFVDVEPFETKVIVRDNDGYLLSGQ
jgi:hypothetical protein